MGDDYWCILFAKLIPWSWVSRCTLTNNLRSKVFSFVGKSDFIVFIVNDSVESSQERCSQDYLSRCLSCPDEESTELHEALGFSSCIEYLWYPILIAIQVHGEVSKIIIRACLSANNVRVLNAKIWELHSQVDAKLLKFTKRKSEVVLGTRESGYQLLWWIYELNNG